MFHLTWLCSCQCWSSALCSCAGCPIRSAGWWPRPCPSLRGRRVTCAATWSSIWWPTASSTWAQCWTRCCITCPHASSARRSCRRSCAVCLCSTSTEECWRPAWPPRAPETRHGPCCEDLWTAYGPPPPTDISIHHQQRDQTLPTPSTDPCPLNHRRTRSAKLLHYLTLTDGQTTVQHFRPCRTTSDHCRPL